MLNKAKKTLIFFGTPSFVVPIPEKLLTTNYCLLTTVVTAPDKPVGRKQILTPSPVKVWAQRHKIAVIDSPSITQVTEQVRPVKPAVGVLAAYGRVLPKGLINLFPKGILVIHPSLLPQYRGPSPVQAAIINGDKETGVTIIKMDEKVDHGSIIAQFKEGIKPDDTTESLTARLFLSGAKVLSTILPAYLEGRIRPRPQDDKKATYTKILQREDGYIDLQNPPAPQMFNRLVRALHPWPGVWSRLRLGSGGQARLIKFLPHQEIQVEGGKPMTPKDFLNGYPEAKPWLSKIFPNFSF